MLHRHKAVATSCTLFILGSNLRFSTPVEAYDRSSYQCYSTAPVNAYGDQRQHRYSIAMASG